MSNRINAPYTTSSIYATDDIDTKLNSIAFVQERIKEIEGHRQDVRKEIEIIKNANIALERARERIIEKERQLADARATLRGIDNIHINGRSIIDDLAILDRLYLSDGDTPEKAIYRWKFRQCRDHFNYAYSVNSAAYKGYTIWITEPGKTHRVDLTWNCGVWRDASGVELRKWGGCTIADHGILINGSGLFKLNYTIGSDCFERIVDWVTYRICDIEQQTNISAQ